MVVDKESIFQKFFHQSVLVLKFQIEDDLCESLLNVLWTGWSPRHSGEQCGQLLLSRLHGNVSVNHFKC